MKSIVLHQPGNVSVYDFPEPVLAEDGVRIAVYYGGLCGTDFHKYHGRNGSRKVTYPVILGHEISGVVEEIGSKVTRFKKGDRVTVDPNYSCGQCWFCRRDMPHMCENAKGVVKGFTEYICPPEANVYPLPETLSLRDACLSEPLSCCLHGISQLDLKIGNSVLIVGLGSIGMMMLELLKTCKTGPIIVVETDVSKKEKALAHGADLFIDPLHEDVKDVIGKAGIRNVDRVFECVGNRHTIQNALHYAGNCATVVLFGVSDPNDPPIFDQYEAFTKELTIKNSFINPYMMQTAIDLLADKTINAEAIIAKEVSMEECVEEIRNPVFSRQGKVIIKIRNEEGQVL